MPRGAYEGGLIEGLKAKGEDDDGIVQGVDYDDLLQGGDYCHH